MTNTERCPLTCPTKTHLHLNGRIYVAGDACFTHWVDAETRVQVTDWATMDALDLEFCARQRAAR